jgi:hypothetical protein
MHTIKYISPRVLYLPNEGSFSDYQSQVGGRAAFNEMLNNGILGALKVYSFLAEYESRQRNKERAHRDLLEVVRSFQPDIIFWQHPNGYPISDKFIKEIRLSGNASLIAYHEGDPFDRYYKLMSNEVMTLYRHSDVFFTIGLGAARLLFSKIRLHPHFYYSPSIFDHDRVGLTPPCITTIGSKYDAIMIGTIGTRIRGLYKQPHSRKRVDLARKLTKLLGARFAVFGNGWPERTNSAGQIPYAMQAATIQTAKMSVMWDLYPDYTFYFSDRLPIAIASGVPFITNRRAGLDIVLANVPGIYQVDTIESALDVTTYLRSLPIEEIASIGAASRAWAFANLEARVVYRKAMNICIEVWKGIR